VVLAYRAGSYVSAGNASGTTLNFAKPIGLANGDVIVYVVYCETDTNSVQIVQTGTSTDAGFVNLFNEPNAGAFFLQAFAKVASSEPTTYDLKITTTPVWRIVSGVAYTSGTGTGTLLDVANGSQGDAVVSGAQTVVSITTLVDNDMVVFGYANFSGSNPTATTGFCTNLRGSFGSDMIADAVKTPVGATGTSRPSAGIGTETYVGIHAGVISDTGGGGGGIPPGDEHLVNMDTAAMSAMMR
jgi:hypothetical protein